MGFWTDDLTPFVFPLSASREGEGFLGGLARLRPLAKPPSGDPTPGSKVTGARSTRGKYSSRFFAFSLSFNI
jgi:hypothetical protein